MKYNNDKNGNGVGMRNLSPMALDSGETATGTGNGENAENNVGVVGASAPETNDYLSVSGMDVSKPKVSSCNNEPVMNPKELLPSDSEWSK